VGPRLYVRLRRFGRAAFGLVAAAFALTQEARELGGKRLAGRKTFVVVEELRPLLQLGDICGRLVVRRNRFADLFAVELRRLIELARVDLGAQDVAQTLAERERGPRARGKGDVVRD